MTLPNRQVLERASPTGSHETGRYNSPLVGKDGPQVIQSHDPVSCSMFTFRACLLLLNLILPICNMAIIFECLLVTSLLLLLSILFLPMQNLTKLKRLNLDGNQLTLIPALPSSLRELKLNDNNLAGLQRQSFRGMRPLTNCLFLGWQKQQKVLGHGQTLHATRGLHFKMLELLLAREVSVPIHFSEILV